MTTRGVRGAVAATLLALTATLLLAVPSASVGPGPLPAHDGHDDERAPALPADFTDKVAIGGLSEPTAVAFAPDGTAFVALKTGLIKSFDYNATSRTYEPFGQETNFADLSPTVHNYWDRGLTGIEVDPQFPARPYVYVNYALNRDPRNGNQPAWSNGTEQYDGCPAGASLGPPVVPGCLVDIRVSRLTATSTPAGWVMTGPELPLVEGACMQFPSHASGDVAIGPDGFLYASAGDGASFDFADHGQAGNPCPGDPANGNEGGSLRSQDVRTAGDALGLSGSVFRVNPDNGRAKNGATDNASRIIAVGHRNPWRLTFRPGTDELWNGDVGGSAWEEINRLVGAGSAPSGTGVANRGWPCYEGAPGGTSLRQPDWDGLNLPVCENLYGQGAAAVQPPYFGYQTRGPLLTPGEDCDSSTSSVSGIAFAPTSSNWPAAYQGSLFFSDYARACVWRLGKLPNGDPDPSSITPLVQGASTPVDLVAGPQGDLFYVDFGLDDEGVPQAGAGGVHRIAYRDPAPVAVLTADRISGPLSATYTFSAAGTTDPNGRPLTYTWDLDGNGSYETSTGATPTAQRSYAAAVNVTVGLKATNDAGQSGTATLTIYPGNDPPQITKISPAASLRWRVGQKVGFSAAATDPQDGVLGAPAFDWALSIRHCPDVCHTHPLEQFRDQQAGSFRTPDHEYPSHLLLTLTLTDSREMPVRRTIRLDPKSVKVTFATSPAKLRLTAAGTAAKAPFAKRFIVGSRATVSAAKVQRKRGVTYRFRSWSDKGKPSHEIVAPKKKRTLTASYRPVKAELRIRTAPSKKLAFLVNGKKWKGSFRDDLKVGTKVWLAAAPAQTRKGQRWVFVRWSDGGRRVHRVVIGDQRVDLRAIYRRA
ncbi:PQQ-dependent sugar dehydrogenase [Nocardioides sp.]|uniref:PQQ-dependent sugar dehydrogenase n=1 Tax=Nocardioides sp. TaxID=35761 RepID=UPI001A277E07|nr:PQQ-dependent sugar dehydrogenase [Nocardioides sp.]MBJ7356348.1 PQQ-dependent sugar dehydrogenase [Nocardioides sp.]